MLLSPQFTGYVTLFFKALLSPSLVGRVSFPRLDEQKSMQFFRQCRKEEMDASIIGPKRQSLFQAVRLLRISPRALSSSSSSSVCWALRYLGRKLHSKRRKKGKVEAYQQLPAANYARDDSMPASNFVYFFPDGKAYKIGQRIPKYFLPGHEYTF